jgi:outer membrane protein assembly factor BamA
MGNRYIRFAIFIFFFFLFSSCLLAENPADTVNTTPKTIKEKKPKPLNFGPLPVITYNTDIGFQYGILLDIYYYGDRKIYPKYYHSLYLEVSRTTKGSGINQVFYDSEHLIPGLRTTIDVTYLTERALDFYGFNGYPAVYNHSWENDRDTANYKTRMFYRLDRQLLRCGLNLQGKFFIDHLKWLAGLTMFSVHIAKVDIDRLNKGLKDNKKLPDVPTLYDHYVQWGILTPNEQSGGMNNFIRLGLVFDTRDNEPNPMHGMWSEMIFVVAPGFLSSNNFGFIKLSLIHRHYFTLIKNRLSFACRLGYQGTIAGKTPFYVQPVMINSWEKTTTIDGLGGSRNLRGILRDRIIGDGIAYGNAEFRWKFYRFRLLRQNFYLALNAFADAGMVVQPIKFDKNLIPPAIDLSQYFSDSYEYPHFCFGGGFRIVMNENFVICADLGQAIDKRDGTYGIYVGFGYLF